MRGKMKKLIDIIKYQALCLTPLYGLFYYWNKSNEDKENLIERIHNKELTPNKAVLIELKDTVNIIVLS